MVLPSRVYRAREEKRADLARERSQLRGWGPARVGGQKPGELVSGKPEKEDISTRKAGAMVSGRTELSRRLPHVEGIDGLGGSRGWWV